MASIIPGYEYDIFISYRHNDNRSGWVTEFVSALQEELAATIKEPVSVYFDTSLHDGLLETHNVDKSLETKLKCLIFIPVISQTYCDPKSFAWQQEFVAFNKMAQEDQFGRDIRLPGGNVASRILPVRIHDIDEEDKSAIENELGGMLRAIDFIFKSPGVNRPLNPPDNPEKNQNQTFYRDQINKIANAIKEIIRGIRKNDISIALTTLNVPPVEQTMQLPFRKKLAGRNLFRASLVYILTGLVLWKVLNISSGLLSLTGNTLQLITLILIVLFPISMVLAWFYERSPKGFIRTGSAASRENPFSDEQKKPFTSFTFISALLVTAMALFVLFPQKLRTQSISDNNIVEKSIAVLPFENMSNDPEQEYFSDGMMQEILNHLFKIGGLKIPSSTSSMRFKGTKLSVKEIAGELNVSYILEGNVSKSGDNVRIIVRLINGKNEQLLWSDDYKRTVTAVNLLEIQSDVARQVAINMNVLINPEVRRRIDAKPTLNTEAYTLFLKASSLSFEFDRTKSMLERAIILDPGFADAYALLANFWINSGGHAGGFDRDKVLENAEPLLKKALQLDNNSIMAHSVMASLKLYYYWDFESVENEYRIVNELNPSNSDFPGDFLSYLLASGKYSEAFIMAERSFNQDKNFIFTWVHMALAYYFSGQPEKAFETIDTARILFPDNDTLDDFLFTNSLRLFDYMGKYDKSIWLFEKNSAGRQLNDLIPYNLGTAGYAYVKTGNTQKANTMLQELLLRSGKSPVGSPSFFAATVYTAMGANDKAIDLLEKAVTNHEVEIYWLKVEPLFRPLHGNPRFENLLLKIGFK